MKITLEEIHLIYEKMVNELKISSASIVIFCSLDVDAVCSMKILTNFLKAQHILYKTYPVSGYTELDEKIQQAKKQGGIKMFMFINCGAILDLQSKGFKQQASVFLFDVNKPVHHGNIESQNVYIIDDGHSELQNHPTSQEMKDYQQLFDVIQDNEQHNQQLQQEDYEDQEGQLGRRRPISLQFQKIKRRYQAIDEKIDNYYNKHFYGIPSSFIIYKFVRELNKANNNFLWWSIIGSTSMFLQNKLQKQLFDKMNETYRSDVIKLNPQAGHRDIGNITKENDYQFILMKHWSLYESMINSSYMILKMGFWKSQQAGLNKIRQFLLNAGITLEQAKNLYKLMGQQAKKKFTNSIFVFSERFGVPDIIYESFSRQIDMNSEFMASEYYYILNYALSQPQAIPNLQNLNSDRVKNFWETYDLLEAPQSKLLEVINKCKYTYKVLAKQALGLMEKDHSVKMGKCYFVNIRNDSPQRKILEHPYTLIKLAQLLLAIQHEKKRSKTYFPLLASLHDVQTNMCTVVGVTNRKYNSFGTKFIQIANKMSYQIMLDSFSADILNIQRENLIELVREIGNL